MKFFALRPLCFFCSVCLLLQLAMFSLPLLPKLTALALGIIGLVILLLLRHREITHFRMLVLTAAALILSGGISVGFISLPMQEAEALTAGSHTIEGYITERVSYADYRSVYKARITSIDGEADSMKIELTAASALDLDLFDHFTAKGSFVLFNESLNGYPERRVMASRGMFSLFEADAVTFTGEREMTLTRPFVLFRERLVTLIERYIGGDEGSLVSALLLAERGLMPEDIKRDFSALGISHILAMSGLHLAILTDMAERIMKRLHMAKKLRLILLTLLIAAFTLLVGAPLSVVRSALMLVLCYLAELLRVRRDKTTSLTLAMALICSFSPGAVMDVGLQLSFSAALGMTAAAPGMRRFLFTRLPKKLARAASGTISNLTASLCAVIFTLPLVFLYFGRISLLSPIATLAITPLVEVILTAAPIMLITSPIPGIAAIFALLCRLSARCMLIISSLGKPLHDLSVSLDYPFSGILIAALVIGAVLLFLSDKGCARHWSAILLSFTLLYAFGIVGSAWLSRHDSTLIFANNGTKDYLCLAKDGEHILIDISDGSYSGIYILTEAMRDCIYDDRFDGVMLTHYHRKHAAMLHRLSEEQYIERLILPEPETEEEYRHLSDLALLADSRGMMIEFYRRGDEFELAGLTVETLPRRLLDRSTHPLIGITFSGEEGSAAYLGAEACQATDIRPEALLIFGGHGPIIRETIELSQSTAVFLSADAYQACSTPDLAPFTPVFSYIMRSRS